MQDAKPQLTYGVEEEFFWLDGQEEKGKSPPFENWKTATLPFSLGREAHAGVVEAISPVCDSLKKLAEHIRISRHWLAHEASLNDARLFAGGTHPTVNWQEEPTTLLPYYQSVIADFGAVVRSNLIFGQHVHVGNMDEALTVKTFNALRPYLPVLCAIAANSTHWRGEHTGIACFRQCVFSKLPRTGTPPKIDNLQDARGQAELMIKLGFIKSPTQFWYDARIHPKYDTIEIRVMDMQDNPDLAVAVALLAASIATKISQGETVLADWDMPDWMIHLNRWQAIRHGRQAMFINAKGEKVAIGTLFQELLSGVASSINFVDPAAYQALRKHMLLPLEAAEVRHVI